MSNAARFEQGYREIAGKVKLPRRDDPRANVLQLVSEWLSDERNGPWLMILDNANDDDIFFYPKEDTEGGMHANRSESVV